MRNFDQLTARRRELLALVDEAEGVADCSCPNHSRHERREARRLAASLYYSVQQIEWAMGLRDETFVDELGSPENFPGFSAN